MRKIVIIENTSYEIILRTAFLGNARKMEPRTFEPLRQRDFDSFVAKICAKAKDTLVEHAISMLEEGH